MFFAREPALESLSELGPRTRAALGALLPGPVTLLLENSKSAVPVGVRSGRQRSRRSSGYACRCFEGPLAALAGIGVPAAQSSANLSGGADPRDLQSVPAELREGVDLVLDGGELPGVASTVIDLSEYEQSGRWRIVREGPLDEAAIAALLA